MAKRKTEILIIDDNVDMLKALSRALEREGYLIETARTGEEACRKARKAGFSLAIVDYKMPGMDGIETLKEIGKTGLETAVIMMTAYGTVDIALEALRKGAFDYISKPFKMGEMIMLIKRGLKVRELTLDNKRFLRELQRANKELKETQQQLAKSERLAAIGQVVVSVNHNINNPLGVIKGQAQFLIGRVKDKETKRRLRIMEKQADRISEVMGRLRRMTDPGVRKYVGDISMIDLKEMTTARRNR